MDDRKIIAVYVTGIDRETVNIWIRNQIVGSTFHIIHYDLSTASNVEILALSSQGEMWEYLVTNDPNVVERCSGAGFEIKMYAPEPSETGEKFSI